MKKRGMYAVNHSLIFLYVVIAFVVLSVSSSAQISDADRSRATCQQVMNGGPTIQSPLVFKETAHAGNRCCGNDDADVGAMTVDGRFLCTDDNGRGQWEWIDVNQQAFVVNAEAFDVISDGSNWVACNAPLSSEFVEAGGTNLEIGQIHTITTGEDSNSLTHAYICTAGELREISTQRLMCQKTISTTGSCADASCPTGYTKSCTGESSSSKKYCGVPSSDNCPAIFPADKGLVHGATVVYNCCQSANSVPAQHIDDGECIQYRVNVGYAETSCTIWEADYNYCVQQQNAGLKRCRATTGEAVYISSQYDCSQLDERGGAFTNKHYTECSTNPTCSTGEVSINPQTNQRDDNYEESCSSAASITCTRSTECGVDPTCNADETAVQRLQCDETVPGTPGDETTYRTECFYHTEFANDCPSCDTGYSRACESDTDTVQGQQVMCENEVCATSNVEAGCNEVYGCCPAGTVHRDIGQRALDACGWIRTGDEVNALCIVEEPSSCTTGTPSCPDGRVITNTQTSCNTQETQYRAKCTRSASSCSTEPVTCNNRETQDVIACGGSVSGGSLLECQGFGVCQSTSELCKSSGEEVSIGQTDYYCAEDLLGQTDWTTNLGSDPSYKRSCEAAGFVWTGSSCCGDLIGESYNDPLNNIVTQLGNTIGGCFRSVAVLNNTRVGDNNVIADGSFNRDVFAEGNQNWQKFPAADTNRVRVDNRKLLIIGSSEQAVGTYQDLSGKLEPLREYTFTGKVATTLTTGTRVSIGLADVNGRNFLNARYDVTSTQSEEEFSVTFATPAEVQGVALWIYVYAGDLAGSQVWIDELYIEQNEKRIMNYEGQFYGCGLDSGEYATGYDDLLHPGPDDLVLNEASCAAKGSFFCSPDIGWSDEEYVVDTDTNGRAIPEQHWQRGPAGDRNATSLNIPGASGSAAACCPTNYCFNGTMCLEDQSDEHQGTPQVLSNGEAFICDQGEWANVRVQYDLQGNAGHCSEAHQCLKDATAANGCVDTGTNVNGLLCENGVWTSRDKLIATKLLSIARNHNHVLFCDVYNDAINDYLYPLVDDNNFQFSVEEYIYGGEEQGGVLAGNFGNSACQNATTCVNNFCVLQYDHDDNEETKQKTIVGTSLNQDIDADQFAFQDVLYARCENVEESEGFSRCRNTVGGETWYDVEDKLVLYSKDHSFSPVSISREERFATLIRNPIQTIISFIQQILNPRHLISPDVEFDYSFIDRTAVFNTLYFSKQGNRQIKGIEENTRDATYLVVNYTGFDVDLCQSVNLYDEEHVSDGFSTGTGLLSCGQENGVFYVLTRDAGQNRAGGLEAWQALTASLRVSPSTEPVSQCVGEYPATCEGEGGVICGPLERCESTPINACDSGIGSSAQCCPSEDECAALTCEDGTERGECSTNKPYYCDADGRLEQEASTCGCPGEPGEQIVKGDECCSPRWSCTSWSSCQDGTRYCLDFVDVNQCGGGSPSSSSERCRMPTCSDGTLYDTCSFNQPKRCEDGGLVDRAGLCGCHGELVANGNVCVSQDLPLICQVKTSCAPEEQCVFKLSDRENGHAGTCASDYAYSICCGGDQLHDDATPILFLDEETNAHISTAPDANYYYPVALGSNAGNVECSITPEECADLGTYSCLASISDTINAHSGVCGAYNLNVCCRLEHIPCSDGTPRGQCSTNQPYYCDVDGELRYSLDICGCLGQVMENGECVEPVQCGDNVCDASELGSCNVDCKVTVVQGSCEEQLNAHPDGNICPTDKFLVGFGDPVQGGSTGRVDTTKCCNLQLADQRLTWVGTGENARRDWFFDGFATCNDNEVAIGVQQQVSQDGYMQVTHLTCITAKAGTHDVGSISPTAAGTHGGGANWDCPSNTLTVHSIEDEGNVITVDALTCTNIGSR